jgi:hypothetical protein
MIQDTFIPNSPKAGPPLPKNFVLLLIGLLVIPQVRAQNLLPPSRLRNLRPLNEILKPAPTTRVFSLLDSRHCPLALRRGVPILTEIQPDISLYLNIIRTIHVVERE